jgi:asparagine synthase (glutamine-hydrolysing)
MCGLTGIYAFSEAGKQMFANLEKANDILKNRGPDGGQVIQDGPASLGHRRLSIIDVSCEGDQPMTTKDGRYTIVFNGEIFNYRELKEQHLNAEERQALHSTSDTEVMLVLYARIKEKIFDLLSGFFVAAFYDRQENSIMIVRDRFGKKPLVYYRDDNKLCFASEMKALFELGVPREVNWDLLPTYLQLSYVPQPYSLIRGVMKLPPGHYMTITHEAVNITRYYELKTHPEKYDSLTYDKAQEELRVVMDKSVKMRLISDVPLGAFLSGGIDSSVVVALAARHTHKLKTYSIGYKDNPYFDETPYANLVAKKYNTDHTVFSLTNDDFLEHIYDVLNYMDEPFADSSAIPEFILSYYTRKHVTVALSGDGGDEVFGGYNKHAAEWRMRNGGFLHSLVKFGKPVWKNLPKSRNNKLTNKIRQLDRYASVSSMTPSKRYWHWASFTKPVQVRELLHSKIKDKINFQNLESIQKEFSEVVEGKDLNEILLADMSLVLPGDMLVKVDLMSMANSLEIRSPFLDHKVVEFAFSLPASYKVDGQMKKKIVQDAFREALPAELYNRRKQGFEIPLVGWFKKELWSLINDDLLEENFLQEQEVFNVTAIRHLKKQLHSANPGDSHFTIWALMVFQYWWKRYIAVS